MSRDFEIAIVGGGPAGAATALFLCAEAPELAERVVLVDKATFPRDKICAGAIGLRGDRLLGSISVEVDVPSVEVRGLHVRTAEGELHAVHPRPIGRVVRRKRFDAALLDHVRAAGIEVREGTRVRHVERSAVGVRLHTDAGELRTAAVVGADGIGSVVRRNLGFSRGHFHAQVAEVDTRPRAADPSRDFLSFDIGDRDLPGYAWDFPTVVDGEALVCRGVYALTRGLDGPKRDVSELLQSRLAHQGVEPVGPIKRFAERGLSLYEPLAVDRVLLVGEAAGIDPVLGEGIPQAIFYGKMAASYLARCWRAEDYRFTDYRRSMRRARIGVDLRIRAALVHAIYGPTRARVERWVTSSQALAEAGMCYFAGEPVPRRKLLRASLDLLRPRWAITASR